MKVIRYAISKKDLHTILGMIGVLKPTERLLAVENVDLIDDDQEVVVVTVSTDVHHVRVSTDLESWTDKELNDRYTQLAILDNHHRQERSRLTTEMEKLAIERRRRSFDTEITTDGIPEAVDRNLTDQIRDLLYGQGNAGH